LTDAASPAALSPVRSAAAAAIVLAGGSGARLGVGRNKVYLPLGERTVLGWSLRAFAMHPAIGTVVLVTRPEDAEQAEGEIAALAVPIEVVTGGATRQDSEWCGLHRLADRIAAEAIETVLIHDGARPLVSATLISAVLAAARADGGAVPGLLRDDLAAVTPDGACLRWPADADALVAVQTPQGFRAGPLLAAYERARREGFVGTDTASCVQRFTDLSVRWVPGDERNLKITYPHDLARVARLVSPVTR
jgi:2-C-methyl-D-erythritol 4-phosphate cytidylyltransferase